jgi:hypothetical protein
MRYVFRKLVNVAGIVAAIASVSHANSESPSPSDTVLQRKQTTQQQLLAPTATTFTSLAAPAQTAVSSNNAGCESCCDASCDSAGRCGRGSMSQLFGACKLRGCDSVVGCDDNSGDAPLGSNGCGLFSNLRGCDSGCDSGGSSGWFAGGIIKPGEKCFNDFISPVSNPVFFEDPRTLTQVRFLFINHEIPAALGGNSVQVYAAQIRLALSQRWSLIATKDGFIYTKSDLLDSGFADIAAGLKYNLYRDPVKGRILSVGAVMEAPTGSKKSLQGNGGGEWNFFYSSGTRILGSKRAHWLSTSGLRQPNNTRQENEIIYSSNHFDYQLSTPKPVYVFTEFNYWRYLNNGTAFPAAVEGGDLFNLGSVGVKSNDLVTQAVGLRYVPSSRVSTGAAYEFPISNLKGLMADRWTFDLIYNY